MQTGSAAVRCSAAFWPLLTPTFMGMRGGQVAQLFDAPRNGVRPNRSAASWFGFEKAGVGRDTLASGAFLQPGHAAP